MHLFGEFPPNTTLDGSSSDIANSARLIDVFFKDSPEQDVRIGSGGRLLPSCQLTPLYACSQNVKAQVRQIMEQELKDPKLIAKLVPECVATTVVIQLYRLDTDFPYRGYLHAALTSG
jgi:hypothetical protein